MMNILLIFLGGGVGALIRWVITYFFNEQSMLWPWGILVVNVLGAFILGLVYHKFTPNGLLHNLIIIGFLGSLTTFSTFALDMWLLIEKGQYFQAILFMVFNVVLSVVLIALLSQIWQNTPIQS